MKKPRTPHRLKIMRLDKSQGLLDDLELEELKQLEQDWEDAEDEYFQRLEDEEQDKKHEN